VRVWMGQTKDELMFFADSPRSMQHQGIKADWVVLRQDNVSELINISTSRLLFQ
jgi:hypothetical protein